MCSLCKLKKYWFALQKEVLVNYRISFLCGKEQRRIARLTCNTTRWLILDIVKIELCWDISNMIVIWNKTKFEEEKTSSLFTGLSRTSRSSIPTPIKASNSQVFSSSFSNHYSWLLQLWWQTVKPPVLWVISGYSCGRHDHLSTTSAMSESSVSHRLNDVQDVQDIARM